MHPVDSARTWAEWRADFEASGIIRRQSDTIRARQAAKLSPLVSFEAIDDYELYYAWDPKFGLETARCVQVPFVCWPHPGGGAEAIMALATYLVAMVVGLNSDLCLVPGVAAKSDLAERLRHDNESQAREAFLKTISGTADE